MSEKRHGTGGGGVRSQALRKYRIDSQAWTRGTKVEENIIAYRVTSVKWSSASPYLGGRREIIVW